MARFALETLDRPEATEEEQGWILLCRFPTVRRAHTPHLLDLWGHWLSHKEPEVEGEIRGRHLGAIGDRLELRVTVTRINGPYAGEFGDSYLCVMESEEHDLLCWWTGENLSFEEGNTYHIRGTVKKHDEFNGTRQTHLQRVREMKSLVPEDTTK